MHAVDPPGVPHTLGVPPPPQVVPGAQSPQSTSAPQPSATGPQVAPADTQVRGAHRGDPHTLAIPPPPQVVPAAQVPHVNNPPQPLETGPQFAPTPAQLRATHGLPASAAPPVPQTLGVPPPPQVVPDAQAPHISNPPQPSATGPQLAPVPAHVRATHALPASTAPPVPQTLGRPPPPQVWPAAQVPHINNPPQPSDTGPHVAPAPAQVRATQLPPPGVPHWLARPPPPQVCGAAQVPHISSPPQPSPTGPQVAPTLAQVRGAHALPPQRLASVAPQVWPAVQVPHINNPPHPSDTGPHVAPTLAQVRATHTTDASPAPPTPHTLARPPPPQLCPVGQLPQSSRPPQPSPAGPQLTPIIAQVRGVQPMLPPHWLKRPPPPQVCGAAQSPHWTTPPQPSPMGPHVAPAVAHVINPHPRRGTSAIAASLEPRTSAAPSVSEPVD